METVVVAYRPAKTAAPEPGGRFYLIGFMAAGKSAVGKVLAELLGAQFVDLDREIERSAGASVREIFENQGEAAFRDLEHQALQETAGRRGLVVATGGGTATFERNRRLLRRLGQSIWLNPSFETILGRLSERGIGKRPLFRDPVRAHELYQERLDAYRTADFTIDVLPRDTAHGVAARIHRLIRGPVTQ